MAHRCDAPERLEHRGELLALVVRAGLEVEGTVFLTPPDAPFQLGIAAGRAGDAVAPHLHRPIERRLEATAELVVVRTGRCAVDVFDGAGGLVASRELAAGDAVLFLVGGHGFRMLEPTRLLVLKQGPWAGADEKRRIER